LLLIVSHKTGEPKMSAKSPVLRPLPLALSLATFFAVLYLGCLVLALIVPDRGLHAAWLQFIPGFAWTLPMLVVGFVVSLAYGFVAGIIFAPIYNFFNSR
jgi:hypothetical protein